MENHIISKYMMKAIISTHIRCGAAAGDTRATLCVQLAGAALKSTTGA